MLKLWIFCSVGASGPATACYTYQVKYLQSDLGEVRRCEWAQAVNKPTKRRYQHHEFGYKQFIRATKASRRICTHTRLVSGSFKSRENIWGAHCGTLQRKHQSEYAGPTRYGNGTRYSGVEVIKLNPRFQLRLRCKKLISRAGCLDPSPSATC